MNLNLFISPTATARDALRQLDLLGVLAPVLFVREENRIVGTITDGDIRRGLLQEKQVDDPVQLFMFTRFRSLSEHYSQDDIRNLRKLNIRWVPILTSDGGLLRIVDLDHLSQHIPVSAVLMAGGRGERLRPLTDHLPKPMLKVGEKPIIEHNITRLRDAGITDFILSIRYLGEKIRNYFGDGSQWGVQIQYIEENEPLGTIGACRLVPKWSNPDVLVMNADILTNFSVSSFVKSYQEAQADMMVMAIPYHVTIPYGVLETNSDRLIQGIKEKPTYTYFSNAGIYLMKSTVFDLIPREGPFHATDLLEKVRLSQKRVVAEPLVGYWLDMGRPEEYARAQEDIKRIIL